MTTRNRFCQLSRHMKTFHLGRTICDSLYLALLLAAAPVVLAEDEFTFDSATNAAVKGNPQAEYFLARYYEKGIGMPKDFKKAAKYMREAAEQGVVFAQNDLGVLYTKGLGVKQDPVEAVKWFRKAAENGDPLGQFSLGKAYAEGSGVTTNITEALKWYQAAGAQNQPEAMLALGYIYQYGTGGVPVDDLKACDWFNAAAAHGRVDGLNNEGFLYEHGARGIPQDYSQAVKYYRAAAEKNDGYGQMNLGRMYENGLGVPRDLVTAYEWYYLARQNGGRLANHYLMGLSGRDPLHGTPLLTQDQIAEAVGQADAFEASLRKSTQK